MHIIKWCTNTVRGSRNILNHKKQQPVKVQELPHFGNGFWKLARPDQQKCNTCSTAKKINSKKAIWPTHNIQTVIYLWLYSALSLAYYSSVLYCCLSIYKSQTYRQISHFWNNNWWLNLEGNFIISLIAAGHFGILFRWGCHTAPPSPCATDVQYTKYWRIRQYCISHE